MIFELFWKAMFAGIAICGARGSGHAKDAAQGASGP